MGNIIGLCGRCYSGKTELANVCQKLGYEKLSFATPLKELIAKILNTTIDGVNQLKNVEINFTFSTNTINIIHNETQIPINIIEEKISDKVFKNSRELLQIIGTDLIREYNNDWHVNKLKEKININKKYIFDDVRFPNEKKMIEDLGGDTWFIIRPDLSKISNHISETSLNWKDFKNIIINNEPLSLLLFKWEFFISKYEENKLIRKKLLDYIEKNKNNFLSEWKYNSKELKYIDMFFIYKDYYSFNKTNLENIENVVLDNNNVKIIYNNDTEKILLNPFEIEDIKKFL